MSFAFLVLLLLALVNGYAAPSRRNKRLHYLSSEEELRLSLDVQTSQMKLLRLELEKIMIEVASLKTFMADIFLLTSESTHNSSEPATHTSSEPATHTSSEYM